MLCTGTMQGLTDRKSMPAAEHRQFVDVLQRATERQAAAEESYLTSSYQQHMMFLGAGAQICTQKAGPPSTSPP